MRFLSLVERKLKYPGKSPEQKKELEKESVSCASLRFFPPQSGWCSNGKRHWEWHISNRAEGASDPREILRVSSPWMSIWSSAARAPRPWCADIIPLGWKLCTLVAATTTTACSPKPLPSSGEQWTREMIHCSLWNNRRTHYAHRSRARQKREKEWQSVQSCNHVRQMTWEWKNFGRLWMKFPHVHHVHVLEAHVRGVHFTFSCGSCFFYEQVPKVFETVSLKSDRLRKVPGELIDNIKGLHRCFFTL